MKNDKITFHDEKTDAIHYNLLKKDFFSRKHVAICLFFCNFARSKE